VQTCGAVADLWRCCRPVALLQTCGAVADLWRCCRPVALLQTCGARHTGYNTDPAYHTVT
jgi:hypothetical protein